MGLLKAGMIATVFLTCACSGPSDPQNRQVKKDQAAVNRIAEKPPSSFEDTVIIDHESAVFYNPDSIQLDKIKMVNEKRIYETLTHDCFYMMQNARNVLRKYWPRIRIVEVIKARYLMFVKKDKSRICIDLDARKDICGMFIFDLKKNPESVDMPNVDTSLGFYFGK